jgi:Cys-rich protein (TIGR01571 family)
MGWESGICGHCCECDCLFACVLPCVVIGENVQRMEINGINEIPVVNFFITDNKNTSGKGGCACILYSLGILSGGLLNTCPCELYYSNILGCFSVYLHSRIRSAIRKKYKIEHDCCGDKCSDFCCALFCYSCAMAQEKATLDKMNTQQQVNSMSTVTVLPGDLPPR